MDGYKKYGVLAVQSVLIIGSSYLVYSRLSQPDVSLGLSAALHRIAFWQILLVFGLSGLFWFLDTFVWRLLLTPYAYLSFARALRYNIIAQSAGVITPFLVGDYGLRSALLRKEINPRQNTLVTLAYQLLKVSTRILTGVFAAFLLAFSVKWSFLSVLVVVFMLGAGAVVLRKIMVGLANTKHAEKFLGSAEKLDFSKLPTAKALMPAIALFLTFSLQTALLAYWIENKGEFLLIWSTIILTYGITSFLPPLSVFDPVAKTAIGSLLYVDVVSSNVFLIAFTAIWLLNRGLPAVASGLFFKRLTHRFQETAKSTT